MTNKIFITSNIFCKMIKPDNVLAINSTECDKNIDNITIHWCKMI